ncbi:hypothetical protein EYF80_057636 [Liparis tanakae]|uniref:Uncharacterized protein n=1 Tax=Liparis tanakae TaxID=230148 RepID=A0A4Z2ETM4_9TELE|nr:hypothetical protein EYF80_057636 [Liparis tanakae]
MIPEHQPWVVYYPWVMPYAWVVSYPWVMPYAWVVSYPWVLPYAWVVPYACIVAYPSVVSYLWLKLEGDSPSIPGLELGHNVSGDATWHPPGL